MKINKKAFTLVELIVVITILAILGTIAFVSLSGFTNDADKSKILYDVRNLTKFMETRLTKGDNLDNLVLNNRNTINGVNTGATVFSGKYILGNLDYQVGIFDFHKMKINGSDFVYEDKGVKRDYIFSYVKTPKKLFYEFAGQVLNQAGKYDAIISGNYYHIAVSDVKGLISESGSDIGVVNGQTLTGSLY